MMEIRPLPQPLSKGEGSNSRFSRLAVAYLPPLGGGGALVVFRFAFGIMMFLSLVRFVANGWIDVLYVQPKFFFTYYGFEWVKPLSAAGMYAVFIIMMLASLFVAFGIFYRVSIITFFLLFTYVELIDKSNYLNHYYFISLLSFLMCFMPSAVRQYSKTDGGLLKGRGRWFLLAIQLQVAIVYFFAGIAKINSDWLLHAMPLKIWLASKSDLPVIGKILSEEWVAYAFSWCGMLFDVSIAFFLFHRKTVWYAYAVVVVFHVLTAILFPGIGMFPFIMMVCATIFLAPPNLTKGKEITTTLKDKIAALTATFKTSPAGGFFLGAFFLIQFALPFRYMLYPENLFWHEQGYRFSWRVMLMEKAGTVFFTLKNKDGKFIEVNNRDFLTMQQEKQMSTQPDMILQFAHHLADVYQTNEVYAEAYACLNGRASQLLIDPKKNLCEVQDGFSNKDWITTPSQTVRYERVLTAGS